MGQEGGDSPIWALRRAWDTGVCSELTSGPGKVVAASREIGKCAYPARHFMPVSHFTSPAGSQGNYCQRLLVLVEKLRPKEIRDLLKAVDTGRGRSANPCLWSVKKVLGWRGEPRVPVHRSPQCWQQWRSGGGVGRRSQKGPAGSVSKEKADVEFFQHKNQAALIVSQTLLAGAQHESLPGRGRNESEVARSSPVRLHAQCLEYTGTTLTFQLTEAASIMGPSGVLCTV